MKLVSQYKYIITFIDGRSSKIAHLVCKDEKIDSIYFPTPLNIDRYCEWCLGFRNSDTCLKMYDLFKNKINVGKKFLKGDYNVWLEM